MHLKICNSYLNIHFQVQLYVIQRLKKTKKIPIFAVLFFHLIKVCCFIIKSVWALLLTLMSIKSGAKWFQARLYYLGTTRSNGCCGRALSQEKDQLASCFWELLGVPNLYTPLQGVENSFDQCNGDSHESDLFLYSEVLSMCSRHREQSLPSHEELQFSGPFTKQPYVLRRPTQQVNCKFGSVKFWILVWQPEDLYFHIFIIL